MIRSLIVAALAAATVACAPTPALAQSVGGCGTTAIAKADANSIPKMTDGIKCRETVKKIADDGIKLRTARIAAITPKPVPSPAPTPVPTPTPVASPTPAPAIGAPVTPIAVITDLAPYLMPGYERPDGTRMPEDEPGNDVGAFRIICQPNAPDWLDQILYPGGVSPHGHIPYGNTTSASFLTYELLRQAGGGSCSNDLNRSRYWAPWVQNAAGKIILPDYIFNYYKRLPMSDPRCFERAAKGCAAFPTGLRALTGYDMKRMGQAQPENIHYSHRCISDGRPSIHRLTLTEAVADCGDAGQIVSLIGFGDCWNGLSDSADHRSQLAFSFYNGEHPYPVCPATHPYLVTQLTQQYVYTIAKDDGPIRLSCDSMPGMPDLAPGTCMHADVWEGWEPAVRDRFEALCINRRKSCVDGELGDGTMMKRGDRPMVANPRLVDQPARPSTIAMMH